MVDDGSTIKDLGDKLDKYVRQYMPIVKILRTTKRQGLIKAKTEGAKVAKSEVLVFLDSHCEAYHNWLPPLLGPLVTIFFLREHQNLIYMLSSHHFQIQSLVTIEPLFVQQLI